MLEIIEQNGILIFATDKQQKALHFFPNGRNFCRNKRLITLISEVISQVIKNNDFNKRFLLLHSLKNQFTLNTLKKIKFLFHTTTPVD